MPHRHRVDRLIEQRQILHDCARRDRRLAVARAEDDRHRCQREALAILSRPLEVTLPRRSPRSNGYGGLRPSASREGKRATGWIALQGLEVPRRAYFAGAWIRDGGLGTSSCDKTNAAAQQKNAEARINSANPRSPIRRIGKADHLRLAAVRARGQHHPVRLNPHQLRWLQVEDDHHGLADERFRLVRFGDAGHQRACSVPTSTRQLQQLLGLLDLSRRSAPSPPAIRPS